MLEHKKSEHSCKELAESKNIVIFFNFDGWKRERWYNHNDRKVSILWNNIGVKLKY